MAIDAASSAWILISTALIWIMIPGIGLFYSGMTKRKSALSFLWLSLMAIAVTSIQWFLFGYSLSFSLSGSKFIGDFAHIASIGVFDGPALGVGVIPDSIFYLFELMFAATATTVVIGAVAERGRILPTIVFVFVWTTVVYNFLAHWIWSSNGWAAGLGALDFAGGVPVHLAAGTGALVYSFLLGRRQSTGQMSSNRPHNINNIFLGTALSWFGWFGFNGGSGLTISARAGLVCIVTNLAACTGGFTWCCFDYFFAKPKHKFSLFGFCMGAMAGLVCITPASGYVCAPTSLVFGIIGSISVYFGRNLKYFLRVDDPFDIFAQHGIGGFVGTILTGIFAQSSIPKIDHVTIRGGWIDQNWMQIVYQLAYAGAGFLWTLLLTSIILILMNRIPGLVLRVNDESELQGIDFDQFNEFTHDYIEFQRDLSTDMPKSPVINNRFVTVTTIDHQNNVHKQNDVKMVKIKPIAIASNGW